jgi:hypothetical protein
MPLPDLVNTYPLIAVASSAEIPKSRLGNVSEMFLDLQSDVLKNPVFMPKW